MFSSLIAPALTEREILDRTLPAAFNDPLSNAVFLGTALSRSKTLGMLSDGTYPLECLGPFLHEGTHHQCFDTPVGYALLGIESFSRLSWWTTLDCSNDASGTKCAANPTCFNRTLVRSLFQLLAPLSEGLALYGELEASPGSSPAASALLFNSLALYCFKDLSANQGHALSIDKVVPLYRKLLSDARQQTFGTFQKTRFLLGQNPPPEGADSYTLGYRWILYIIAMLHRHSAAARDDADVTLAFLCSYFFRDWRLAEMLSDASWAIETGRPTVTIEEISHYLEGRVSNLLDKSVKIDFDEFESCLVQGNLERCSSLNFSDERERKLYSFNAQAGATELHWQAPKTTRFRHVLRVATMTADEITLSTSDGTFVCKVEDVTLMGAALTGGFPADAEGAYLRYEGADTAIEVVLVAFQILVCVFCEGSLVGVLDRHFRAIDTQVAEETLGGLSPFSHAEHWRRRYWDLLDPKMSCEKSLRQGLTRAELLAQRLYCSERFA